MADRHAGTLPLIEKVLAGSCVVAIASYALSESALTLLMNQPRRLNGSFLFGSHYWRYRLSFTIPQNHVNQGTE